MFSHHYGNKSKFTLFNSLNMVSSAVAAARSTVNSTHSDFVSSDFEHSDEIQFTDTQEALIAKVNSTESTSWAIWPQFKLALLVDIYGGLYPEIFQKDDTLFNEYSKKLINYCHHHHCLIPAVTVHNAILSRAYKKQDKEQNKHRKHLKSKDTIKVPPTKKAYLENLQKLFSTAELTDITFHRDHFLYANDGSYISYYYDECYKQAIDNKPHEQTFNLLDSLQPKPQKHRVGIVIGNGTIISLLPEIPADDIILLDHDPLVHFFVLSIRQLILSTDNSKSFDKTKEWLIHKIEKLEFHLRKDKELNFPEEMRILGHRHFLYNEARFKQCKKALKRKELLPVCLNMFNHGKMREFAHELREANCYISFMNLTNLADYDEGHDLFDVISKLPLAEKYKIVSTSLIGYPGNRWMKNECFISTTFEELKSALDYSYERNQRSFFGYAW